MKSSLPRSAAVAGAVAVLLAAGPARAATTLVIQRGSAQPTTTDADDDHTRVAAAGGGDVTAVLRDGAARKLVMINDREKTYTEIPEEQLKQMRDKVMAARALMAEQVKNLPPEKRQKMEAMM